MCDRCRETLFQTLGGAAACRGSYLADRIATRTEIREPWPDTAKAHAVELAAVVDLSTDALLRERFARELRRAVVRRWDEIRAGSPVRRPK